MAKDRADGRGGNPSKRTTVRKRATSPRKRGAGQRWLWLWVVLFVAAGVGFLAYRLDLVDWRSVERIGVPGLRSPATREVTLYPKSARSRPGATPPRRSEPWWRPWPRGRGVRGLRFCPRKLGCAGLTWAKRGSR
jgi:hypothetical protein